MRAAPVASAPVASALVASALALMLGACAEQPTSVPMAPPG